MAFRSRFPVPAGPRTRWGWTLPLGLIVAVAAADLLTPPAVHLGPLLVVAPAVAAAYCGVWVTGLIGLVSVGALAAIGVFRSDLFTENLLVQLGALALLTMFLVVFCALRERRGRELDRARNVAEATQRVLLRPLPQRSGPLAIASHYRAAEADTRIGGDLYAAVRTPSGTRLIIGDVSGRGLASISDTATLLGAFHSVAHRGQPLPELMGHLESSVRRGAEDADADRAGAGAEARDPAERFVTAAVLDVPDGEPLVHMVNCGHPPPLVLRGPRAETLATPDPQPPLGLGALLGPRYEVTSHPFAPGDVLLLYTDGLSEARDGTGAFYPLPERAPRWSGEGPEALLRRLAADVAAYTARPLEDDLAMVAVRRARD